MTKIPSSKTRYAYGHGHVQCALDPKDMDAQFVAPRVHALGCVCVWSSSLRALA